MVSLTGQGGRRVLLNVAFIVPFFSFFFFQCHEAELRPLGDS